MGSIAREFRRRQELRDRKEVAKVIKRAGGAEAVQARLQARVDRQRKWAATFAMSLMFAGGFAWARLLPVLIKLLT